MRIHVEQFPAIPHQPLPGFAFSDKPVQRGWNVDCIAHAWAELMRRLGYSHYVAQGGDWGAWVTTRLAQQHPAGLLGIHLNLPLVIPNQIPATSLSPDEQRASDSLRRFSTEDFGYFGQQATRPQTIGYALSDSPAGMAAWIYEQFHLHTDPAWPLSLDQMLVTLLTTTPDIVRGGKDDWGFPIETVCDDRDMRIETVWDRTVEAEPDSTPSRLSVTKQQERIVSSARRREGSRARLALATSIARQPLRIFLNWPR
jgi:pimeloyl-ACP methyl ester carboxylesterase